MMSIMGWCLLCFLLSLVFLHGILASSSQVPLPTSSNLHKALSYSILFYEGQRSGKLPLQRVKWRGNSGLIDGADAGLNLIGGYYDAGDNVKFVWTIAHTVTMLSWSAIRYHRQLTEAGEYNHTMKAIRWGSNFLLKATIAPSQLVTQIGDGTRDHACWERPEDMDTPRTVLQIDERSPGSEVAADTAAALAAASMVFKELEHEARYSARLLRVAKQMFTLADDYRGSYNGSCPFYCSYSGYNDELLWGATWLYKASRHQDYLNFVTQNRRLSRGVKEFSWENKFAGVQVLLSKEYLEDPQVGSLAQYNDQAKYFLCDVLSSPKTPGGLIYIRHGYNFQYVIGASFLITVYADFLGRESLTCGDQTYKARDLVAFSRSQVNYILGNNPLRMSFMVGYGERYPQQLHHRGASIPSIHVLPQKVACRQGYTQYYNEDSPNPNIHVGAIVGGPDQNDEYVDNRTNWDQNEPTIYMNAPFVGLLASLL